LQEATAQREHPDAEDDTRDGIEHEHHAKHATDSVEDEKEMNPGDREQDDCTEDSRNSDECLVAVGHWRHLFPFSSPPVETSL
jgi:hypothetical protein